MNIVTITKLKNAAHLVFLAGNFVLLLYSLTHHQSSYPTPDSVVCYEFPTVTGKRYHVKFNDWKTSRPHHWYNNTHVTDSLFDEHLNLNKQLSSSIPTLYLPTCITSCTDVYQFWDGSMNPSCPSYGDLFVFKNTKSANNKMIYMAFDVILGNNYMEEPMFIQCEEIYIIRLKDNHLADIINLKRIPSYYNDLDDQYFNRPAICRDLQMNVFFDVPYRATSFHRSVNHQLPVEERLPNFGGKYFRVWANPLIADSHELRIAMTRATMQFRIDYAYHAHIIRNGRCLIEAKYNYSDDIDNGLSKIWYLPERYKNSPHLSERKKWTFFTFNTPIQRNIPFYF